MMMFLLILILMTAIIGVAVIIYFDKKKRTKAKKGMGQKKGLVPMSTYFKVYRTLDNFFLTRNGLRKVGSKLSALSVYTSQEIRVYSVRFYLIAHSCAITLVLAGAFIFKDLFSTLLVVTYALIMNTVLVDKQIDSIHFKLLKQLSKALSSVRQNYLRLGSIPDAIAEAEAGSLLQRSFEEIYLILTAVDGERRLEEFYASTPFRLLQTFAGVSYILNDAGDSKLSDGSSNFIQSMGMLADEVNLEIRRISLQKARFGLLEILPIAPLAAIGIIESFFSGIIPGTSIIYKGAIGYVSRTIIVLASIIGYTTIVKINSAVSVKKDDRNKIVLWFLSKKRFIQFVKNIQPKKAKKILFQNRKIKRALSMTNIDHLYGSKLFYSFLAFIFAAICSFFTVSLGKEFIYDNVAEISLIGGGDLSEEDIRIRREMDEKYLSYQREELVDIRGELSDEKALEFVNQYLSGLQEFDKQAQVQRLKRKYDAYYNAYFKWWMIILCFMVAGIAWYIPDVFLKGRAWLLKTESEEDVLQLQTIIAILMNTSCDTLDTLYWMERQSRVFKNVLLDAYHEYPSNPELALNRLKAKAVLAEFKRMIDKLILTIHQITLAEAFSDLVSERDHVMRIREITQNKTLKRKRAMVSPLAMTPLVLTAIAYILLPLAILGYKEFTEALTQVGY
ncbi:hypothetical protein [Vallitalea okinawensis]|uniref:hypothetical protein n=1 Tax=Vallitalea okinawensis TaxID=2078660 RepID=UPI000CFC5C27|nr:hypothetical protein [Vallitalea okinawensis]